MAGKHPSSSGKIVHIVPSTPTLVSSQSWIEKKHRYMRPLLDLPLEDVIAHSEVSVRLRNCLTRAAEIGKMPIRTVGDYMAAGDAAVTKMMKVDGLGLKCARELDRHIRRLADGREKIRPRLEPIEVSYSSSVAQSISPSRNSDIPPQQDKDTFKQKDPPFLDFPAILAQLSPRQRDVLIRRYGLYEHQCETLEEIGRRLNVTRERVRQLEAKTIEVLSNGILRESLSGLITEGSATVHKYIATENQVVRNTDVSEIERQLPGPYRLAVTVLYGDVRHWLSKTAIRIGKKWYVGPLTKQQVEQRCATLKKVLTAYPLPRPVDDLAEKSKLEIADVRLAAELLPETSTFLGYITRGRIGRRPRRRICLHYLLATHSPLAPLLIRDLLRLYHEAFPDDQCTARDAEIVMEDAPHLFSQMYDFGWLALGETTDVALSGQIEEPKLVGEKETAGVREKLAAVVDESLARDLAKILNQEGPLEFVTIRDIVAKRFKGRYSVHSAGPTLVMNDEFVRLAPGIYGTQKQRTRIDPIKETSDVLLDTRHCRIYCMARWAGEPQNSYPLWTPAMENAWCIWARSDANWDTFESLLDVVDPQTWPIPARERERWIKIKQLKSAYHFAEASPSLLESVPELAKILSITVFTQWTGGVSWISANRSIGKRIDDRHIASTLALLVWAGILEPANHWQKKHVVIPARVDEVVKLLSQNAFDNGAVVASPDVLSVLLDQKQEFPKLGWVNESEIAELVTTLRQDWLTGTGKGKGVRLRRNARPQLPPIDTLESLVKAYKNRKAIERLS